MSSHRRLTVAQHALLIGLTIFLTMLAVPAVAFAGNGTFKNGQFNFCVSVRFNATEAQALSDKAVDIIRAAESGELPPRIAARPDFYLCRWCAYAKRCWEDGV